MAGRVSRTVPLPAEVVWEHLLGPGAPVWLGVGELGAVGSTYAGGSGSGEVHSRTDDGRVRLTHRARDEHERERVKQHWKTIADLVVADLAYEHHD